VPDKKFLPFILFLLPSALLAQTPGPTYRFFTNLGNIDVILTPSLAPQTVANFINYLNAGAYVNSIFSRSISGFVIQAGGYQFQPATATIVATPTNPPVVNEFNVSNTTGTIAMAKLATDPNSATSQWFFNLANNGTNSNALDTTDGGYTVFGNVTTVTNANSLKVMNAIAALPTTAITGTPNDSAFTNCPIAGGNAFVLISSIAQVPVLTTAGFQNAASYLSNSASGIGISPGEILVIYGQGLGPAQLTPFTVTNGALSTTLAGTQVLFNNKPAPIIYTSAGQVSVIAPVSFASLPTVDVTVTYQGVTSNAPTFQVKPANPAIFTLNASGTGDAAIVELNGSIVSTASPASVGDVLEVYGEGYGIATPATTLPDGQIITGTLPIPNDPTTLLLIDGQSVPWSYFGGSIFNGVLQVNFTVPKLAPGSHQIQIQVGSRTSPTGVTLQTK
jgi:uncharacterized protein (TIGR03437 family)